MSHEYANFPARDISREGFLNNTSAYARVQLGRPATSGYTKVSGRLRSLEAARALGLISDF